MQQGLDLGQVVRSQDDVFSEEEGEAVSGEARPEKVAFETILEGKVEFQQMITGRGVGIQAGKIR